MAFIKKNCSSTGQDDLNRYRDDEIIANERHRIQHSFRHSYFVTDEESERLMHIFNPIYVQPDITKTPKSSSHAVLAVINEWCNHDARTTISRLHSQRVITMSIGDAATNKIGARHNCLKIDSLREGHRIVGNINAPRDFREDNLLKHVVDGTPSATCTVGCERCNFPASQAFAVHSLYDITLDELYRTFDSHGLIKLTAYMYMPLQLYYPMAKQVDADLFKIHDVGDGNIYFTMGDNSIPYVHHKSNWRNLANITVIRGPDFSIVRETVRTYGPMHVLVFTRVNRNFAGEIMMSVNMSALREVCFLPDVVSLASDETSMYVKRQREVFHYTVPRHVVLGLLSYAERAADESYNFKDIATLASGFRRSLKIGSVTYYDSWECPDGDYHGILINTFFMGANYRANRTAVISKLFKELKELQTCDRWWNEVKKKFNRFCSKFFGDDKFEEYPNQQRFHRDTLFIDEWRVVYPTDYIIRSVHTIIAPPIARAPIVPALPPVLPAAALPASAFVLPPSPPRRRGSSTASRSSATSSVHSRRTSSSSRLRSGSHPPRRRRSDVRSPSPASDSDARNPFLEPRGRSSSNGRDTKGGVSEIAATDDSTRVMWKKFDVSRRRRDLSHWYSADGYNHLMPVSLSIAIAEVSANIPMANAAAQAGDQHLAELAEGAPHLIDARPTAPIAPPVEQQDALTPGLVQPNIALANAAEAAGNVDLANVAMHNPNLVMPTPTAPSAPTTDTNTQATAAAAQVTPANGQQKAQSGQAGIIRTTVAKIKNLVTTNRRVNVNTSLRDLSFRDKTAAPVESTVAKPTRNPKFIDLPSNQRLVFRRGHCAMVAFYDAMAKIPSCQQYNVDGFLRLSAALLSEHYGVNHAIQARHVEDYIIYGLYTENDCSSIVLGLLSRHFDVCLTVKHRPNNAHDIVINRHAKYRMTLYFFDYDNSGIGHYSALSTGGAKDKYPHLLDDIFFHSIDGDGRPEAFIELSAAPGMLCMELSKRKPAFDIYAFIYKPGLAKHPQLQDPIKIREYSNLRELANLIRQVQATHRIRYVLCDVGRPVNSEALTADFCEVMNQTLMTRKLEEDKPVICVKTFANPIKVWEIARHFETVRVHSYMEMSTEKYYVMSGVKRANKTLLEMYEVYNQRETTHTVRVSYKTINTYRACFFRKEFLKFGASVPQLPNNGHHDISFNAITGYASASKTTQAAEQYKEAFWIAPTRELCTRHQRKYGLRSFTPHQIFAEKHVKIVVIDECSQFYVEYLGLLRAAFPEIKIVIIGDIHQVPPFDSEGFNGTLFSAIGVENNIWETYAVPHDIVDILNAKYGFHMIPKGGCPRGLVSVKGNPSLREVPGFFKKIKFICFNQATFQDLKSKGFDASTITTYTGSRSHTVVFYVDGASVKSQLLNKPEYVYTALTRATNQLVLYGSDSRMIEQHFLIDGHNIRTFEEINEIRLNDEMYIKAPEMDTGIVKVITHPDEIVAQPVALDTALTICEKIVKNVNSTDVHINVAPNEVPDVTGGTMRTTVDAVLAPQRAQKVYKLAPNHSLVKQQLSNNTLQTLQTLAVRYGQRKIHLSPRELDFTSSELAKGLSMLLTGRPDRYYHILAVLRSRKHELNYHHKEYIIALSKKLGANPGHILEELKEEFNEFNESLEFFNKFQVKHDAKDGFDTSAKVGQGVSATSKKFNLLYNAYSRYILTVCRDIARAHSRKVILATFDDEETLSDEVAAMIGSCVDDSNQGNFVWDLGDLSSADKNYSSANRPLQIDMLAACGAPKRLQDFYHKFRDRWRMRYTSSEGVTVLVGEGNQLSGCPATIQENTLHYGATHFAMKEFIGFQCVLVKGDDIAVLCKGSHYTPRGLTIRRNTGTVVKEHLSPVGEFAGWVLLDDGLFPDVVRYALKFIGKRYRDNKHFHEALASLSCRLVAVKSQAHKNRGCMALTYFYPGLSFEEISLLYDFIANAHTIRFEDLTVCYEEPLVPLKNPTSQGVFDSQL